MWVKVLNKRYKQVELDGLPNHIEIRVRTCLFRVREFHVLFNGSKKQALLSAFGSFKIKDLKALSSEINKIDFSN